MISISRLQIDRLDKAYRRTLINSLIGYRSLHLLGTINKDSISNLCPVSSAFHLGANPPLLGVVMRPAREQNDTLLNIQSTGQFTLNNVLPSWYMQAHQTSASYPSGISEFEMCGFKEHYIDGFKAPFVGVSSIRIGLELREVLEMKINGTTIIVGEIVQILTNNDLIGKDGTVDHYSAETLTVSGLDGYFLPQPLARLTYAKPGIQPSVLREYHMNKKQPTVIVVVEDDPDTRYIMRAVLEDRYTVHIRSTIAADELLALKADLVFMDLWLENGSGADLCLALKKNSNTNHIPVILCSAVNGLPAIQEQCQADAYITKPFDLDDLIRVVEEFTSGKLQ